MSDEAGRHGHGPAPAQIGFWVCTALVVGNTIGMGIFKLPQQLAPFGTNALPGWCITAAGCVALALVFSRLARRFPDADGPYAYIRITQGQFPAFIAAWCYWVSLWITNAALVTGVVDYLQALAPIPDAMRTALALALLWTFVAINLRGVQTSGPVQVLTTTLKLVPLLLVIVMGAWLLLADASAYTPPSPPIGGATIMAASTATLYSMLGLESATVPAAHVRDPARTIPRATLVGTLVTAGIYIAVSAIALYLIPSDELARSDAPFVAVLDRLMGGESGRWIGLFIVISGLGALNGWTMLVGDLTRTMANNGVLPSALADNNPRGAPALALLVTGALASGMVALSAGYQRGFEFMTLMVTAANLPLYLLCGLAIFILAMRGKQAKVDVMLIGFLGVGYSMFALFGMGRDPFLAALGLGAIGLPVFALMHAARRKPA